MICSVFALLNASMPSMTSRYDPYFRQLTIERDDHGGMRIAPKDKPL